MFSVIVLALHLLVFVLYGFTDAWIGVLGLALAGGALFIDYRNARIGRKNGGGTPFDSTMPGMLIVYPELDKSMSKLPIWSIIWAVISLILNPVVTENLAFLKTVIEIVIGLAIGVVVILTGKRLLGSAALKAKLIGLSCVLVGMGIMAASVIFGFGFNEVSDKHEEPDNNFWDTPPQESISDRERLLRELEELLERQSELEQELLERYGVSVVSPSDVKPTEVNICSVDCEYCKDASNSGLTGHILGRDTISTADALEILKHIVHIDSSIDNCENAFRAAAIVNGESVTTADALEILKHIVGLIDLSAR